MLILSLPTLSANNHGDPFCGVIELQTNKPTNSHSLYICNIICIQTNIQNNESRLFVVKTICTYDFNRAL